MKVSVLLIATFLGMFILSSCNEDETPALKDDSWYWGYFKGAINGKAIALENVGHGDWPVQSIKHNVRYLNEPDSIRGLLTGIAYGENEGLSVNLFRLHKGVRYITLGQADGIYNSVNITRVKHTDGGNDRFIYIPKKETPFRVEVINITYVSSVYPILEAELDGVLYRSDNPKDSIIVKGTYGTR